MTVPSEQSRIQYTTDGTSVSFPVPFRFLNAAHLQVARQHNGESSTLDLGVDYSVSGVGNQAGGTITTTSALPAGDTISIERVVPITQETAYQRNDPFPERAHEQALDKLTMICQMLGGVLGLTPGSNNRALLLGAADIDGKGAYHANGNRISNLGAPKLTTDAIRKQDLMEALSGLSVDGSGQYVIERLADDATPENGPGMIVFNKDQSYGEDTLGGAITRRVESVDALRNLQGRFSDDLIYLSGYYEDTPGMGSGYFRWDQGSEDEDNGGTIIGSASGRWIRNVQENFISIHEFGCRPIEGMYSTPDFDIQERIEAAVATGMDVFCNPGRYLYGGNGISLNQAQKIFGKRSGRQGTNWLTTTQIESTKANTPLLIFDYRTAPGNAIYGVSGPSVEGLRLISDFPIRFGDKTSDINNDKHIAPIMLGKIIGNYLQPLTLFEGYGIELTKGFDYEIRQNEIAQFALGIFLCGSDINKIHNNRVLWCRAAHIRIFSTGTFGSQNEIIGNDLLRAGSTSCTFLQSNDRHARIIDNYFEEAYGACFGFVDISPAAVPATVGPNTRSDIFSVVCENNRIDGIHQATQFVYRVDPSWATMISLSDSNTTGPRSPLSVPFNVVGGGLKPLVGTGRSSTHYKITGDVFGLWDGFQSSRARILHNGIEISSDCINTIAIDGDQNADVLITPYAFELPRSSQKGDLMRIYPLGRHGRGTRPYLLPGRTYTLKACVSTSLSAGGGIMLGWGASSGTRPTVTKKVGEFDDVISTTFVAPDGADTGFYVLVGKQDAGDYAIRVRSVQITSSL